MILKSSQIGVSSDELSVRTLIFFIVELKSLLNYIGSIMLESNETIAIAEGVTGGFLQFSFSQMNEASTFLIGGMNVYRAGELIDVLKIDPVHIQKTSYVSSEIAESMALNVAKMYKSDWSISVTGYSRPSEDSGKKLFAYFSITYRGKLILSERLDLHSRTKAVNAQLYYTEFILGCFKLELDKIKQERTRTN